MCLPHLFVGLRIRISAINIDFICTNLDKGRFHNNIFPKFLALFRVLIHNYYLYIYIYIYISHIGFNVLVSLYARD